MERVCQLCNTLKPIDEFPQYKVKDSIGYRKYCKSCYKVYKQKLYLSKREYILLKQKEYRVNNYIAVRERDNNYKKNNREKLAQKQKVYAINNADKIREYKRKWEKEKIKNDPLFKCKKSVMNLIRKSFRRDGLKKSQKTNEILGCTYEEFKQYIESLWQPWMNWDNYGLYNNQPEYGWDIDHIIPLKTAKTEADIIKLCHYTNLQPLCSHYNRVIKGFTLIPPHPVLSEKNIA